MPTVGGFLLEADEDLEVTTDATGATWQAGFLRSPVSVGEGLGKLVVTTSTVGATWQSGFLRAVNGALVVEDAEGTMAGGFERTASGALAVQSGAAGTRYGLKRSATGRVLVNGLGAAPFSPADLTNLAAWYSADDVLNGGALPADNTPTPQWSDKSGNGRNATQGTVAKQPMWRAAVAALNGKPALEFNGLSDWFTIGSMSGLFQAVSGLEVFAAVNVVDTAVTRVVFLVTTNVATSTRVAVRVEADDTPRIFSRRLDSDSAASTGLSVGASNGAHVFNGRIDHSAATLTFARDGEAVSQTAATGQGTGNTSNTAPAGASIGANALGDSIFFNGNIAELIVVNRVLTAPERANVLAYLGTKYGITIT